MKMEEDEGDRAERAENDLQPLAGVSVVSCERYVHSFIAQE